MRFIIYNITSETTGKILRLVGCPKTQRYLQAKDGEFVMKGNANDVTQKIEFDNLDDKGQPVNPRVVDKTSAEIEADKPFKPEPKPFEKQPAQITNEKLGEILSRIKQLERKALPPQELRTP